MEFKLETGRTPDPDVFTCSEVLRHPLLGDTLYSNGKSPYKVRGQTLRHDHWICYSSEPEYMKSAPLPGIF